MKTFITDDTEYITTVVICQIHKTAQTRTACRVVALHEDRWMRRASRKAFYGEYGATMTIIFLTKQWDIIYFFFSKREQSSIGSTSF